MKLFAGSIIVCLCLIVAGSVGEASAQAKSDKLRIDHLAEGQPKYAQYKPGDFIDARTLSDIDKSGYIDKLYGGQAR